jgi:hypothetical protein
MGTRAQDTKRPCPGITTSCRPAPGGIAGVLPPFVGDKIAPEKLFRYRLPLHFFIGQFVNEEIIMAKCMAKWGLTPFCFVGLLMEFIENANCISVSN